MKYQQPSFSVPGSAGNASYCAEHGHTLPDVRGKCLRCSAKVRAAEVIDRWPANAAPCADPQSTTAEAPMGAHQTNQ